MKVFIGGSKTISTIDDTAKQKLLSLSIKCNEILIGDCYGVDAAVQRFFADLDYQNVFVYVSNGVARNNLGNWPVYNVPVEKSIKGFEFYRQKDIAMANGADCGFMIWDGKSKGTLSNLVDLINQNKIVDLYLEQNKKMQTIQTKTDLFLLISKCDNSVQEKFEKICINN